MAKPIDGKRCVEWAKHLKKFGKRVFNKSLRQRQKKEARKDCA